MKKVLAAMLAGLMLVGCSDTKKEEPAATPEATEETVAETPAAEDTTKTEETPADSTGALVGGWTVNDSFNPMLADDEQARFDKAMEGLVGVGYEAIQVVGTQVVAGMNYAYLAMGTTVTAEPVKNYYIITIYENLQGEVEILSIEQIDLANIEVKEADGEMKAGGWEITDTGKPGMLPGEDAQASFDAATEQLLGVTLNPIVLLGSQVVAGTNYVALCRGRTATENPQLNLYVVTWYSKLDGTAELTDNKVFNLEAYISYGEAN